MFIIGFFMGGTLGICIMCLMQIAREDAQIQIHDMEGDE